MNKQKLDELRKQNREFLDRILVVSKMANELFERKGVPHYKYCPMLFQPNQDSELQAIQVLMVPDAEFWRSRLESFHLGIVGELFDSRLFEVWDQMERLK